MFPNLEFVYLHQCRVRCHYPRWTGSHPPCLQQYSTGVSILTLSILSFKDSQKGRLSPRTYLENEIDLVTICQKFLPSRDLLASHTQGTQPSLKVKRTTIRRRSGEQTRTFSRLRGLHELPSLPPTTRSCPREGTGTTHR